MFRLHSQIYQNKLTFVDQVTRKTIPLSIKAPCKTESYRLTPYPINARKTVEILRTDEVEKLFTLAEFTAHQLGIHRQIDWTNSIDNMKFNQLVGNAAETIAVAQAINIADLAKQAQLQARFSQLKCQYNNSSTNHLLIYFNKYLLDWRDLINGNYLKESLIGIFGYPW